jgi:hypothetical protein
MAVEAWNIVNSMEEQPPDESEEYDFFQKRATKALGTIYNSCSEHIRELDDLIIMWDILRTRYDTASSSIAIRRKFDQTKPNPNESINTFFNILLSYRDRLAGTTEEIVDETFKADVYTHMPPEFRGTTTLLQHQSEISLEQVIESLREGEETRQSYNSYSTSNDTSSGQALSNYGNQQRSNYTFTYREGFPRGAKAKLLFSLFCFHHISFVRGARTQGFAHSAPPRAEDLVC